MKKKILFIALLGTLEKGFCPPAPSSAGAAQAGTMAALRKAYHDATTRFFSSSPKQQTPISTPTLAPTTVPTATTSSGFGASKFAAALPLSPKGRKAVEAYFLGFKYWIEHSIGQAETQLKNFEKYLEPTPTKAPQPYMPQIFPEESQSQQQLPEKSSFTQAQRALLIPRQTPIARNTRSQADAEAERQAYWKAFHERNQTADFIDVE